MPKILEDIYTQNYTCFEHSPPTSPEYKALLNQIVELEEKLRGMIPAEAAKVLEAYSDNCADLSDMTSLNAFIGGYRLGIHMILAGCMEDGSIYPKHD